MKICILTSQILSKEKIGGFGSMSLQLAIALARNKYEVHLIALSKRKTTSYYDDQLNIHIHSISPLKALFSNYLKELKVDIFHSQNQSILTPIAQLKVKKATHIITCRDPRDWEDWKIEFNNATWRRKLKIPLNYFMEEGFMLRIAIRNANEVATPSSFLKEKIKRMYALQKPPSVLPNIELVPTEIPKKAARPTVCWVGRFAKRKNPERFLKLSRDFPEVEFLIMGKSEEQHRQLSLEKIMADLPNVTYIGFKDKFRDESFYTIYDTSWILINTAKREGLPLTFIEAAARGCAILSAVNPNNFSNEFGCHVEDDNFSLGLRKLLTDGLWSKQGVKGFEFVNANNSIEKAVNKHIDLYNTHLLEE